MRSQHDAKETRSHTREHSENRVRASRTLSDDIKYIYDCVSRVIGPRIFLAILSCSPFLPRVPRSLDFSPSPSLAPFLLTLLLFFPPPLLFRVFDDPSERWKLVSLPSVSLSLSFHPERRLLSSLSLWIVPPALAPRHPLLIVRGTF